MRPTGPSQNPAYWTCFVGTTALIAGAIILNTDVGANHRSPIELIGQIQVDIAFTRRELSVNQP